MTLTIVFQELERDELLLAAGSRRVHHLLDLLPGEDLLRRADTAAGRVADHIGGIDIAQGEGALGGSCDLDGSAVQAGPAGHQRHDVTDQQAVSICGSNRWLGVGDSGNRNSRAVGGSNGQQRAVGEACGHGVFLVWK